VRRSVQPRLSAYIRLMFQAMVKIRKGVSPHAAARY
jgi:hypothetical protein